MNYNTENIIRFFNSGNIFEPLILSETLNLFGIFVEEFPSCNQIEKVINDLGLSEKSSYFWQIFDKLVDKQIPQICHDMKFLYSQDQNEKERMLSILKNFSEEISSDHEDKYITYLSINIRRLINRMSRIAGYIMSYDNAELIDETENLLRRFPNFYQVYILQGLIADEDRTLSGYSNFYYERAMKHNSDDKCGFISYRLGLFYERVIQNDAIAYSWYKSAYANGNGYKALYKIGCFQEKRSCYKEACDSYERVINQLENTLNNGKIQPIQVEYLFGAYYKMARIYRIYLKQYYKGLDMTKRAINLIKEEKFAPFFTYFYNERADDKLECMRKFFTLDEIIREKTDLENEVKFLYL